MPGTTLNSLDTFGALLKHLRRRSRLTQRELGVAVGYSEAHMARLENGQRLPDVATVRSLFVPALELDREPDLAARLISLAEAAHGDGSVDVWEDAASAGAAPRDAHGVPLPNNLPAQLTSFIGREREKADVAALLSASRLLTITGSGGAGKTRLAVEVGAALAVGPGAAARAAPTFPDGVWLVDLAPVAEEQAAANAIAAALNYTSQNRPALDWLADSLRGKELLLILDNCEHLIGACARIAETLLRACPGLRILATSREALNVTGETAWRIPPLAADDAVQVFTERARAAKPGFALTDRNTPVVAHICERLDGMPLAIELAASRLPALSIEQLAARLDDRFNLLSGGSRTALPRHQTLRTLIDWSYDLLSEPERRLLQRLSVFAGGWTLEAAEEVCVGGKDEGGRMKDEEGGDTPLPPSSFILHPSDVLPLLFDLVRKSLVSVDERSDETRYRLSETVREYALGKLRQSGELEILRRRHAEAFLALAEQAETHLLAKEQKRWGNRLTRELDNIRAALAWARASGDSALGLGLAGALWLYWLWHGNAHEGLRWLEELLHETAAGAPPHILARAFASAGALALSETELSITNSRKAAAWLEQALEWYHGLGDRAGIAAVICLQGMVAWSANDLSGAQSLFERSLAAARQAGNPLVAAALERLANLAVWRQEWTRATALYEECLAAERRAENGRGVARALLGLGLVALRKLDFARAIELSKQGWQAARTVDHAGADLQALMQIGEASRYLGDFDQARASFEELYRNSRSRDDEYGANLALQLLGKAACDEGDYGTARRLFIESLARRERLGEWSVPYNLEGLAAAAAGQGQPARAASLFGAAEAIRETIHWPLASDNVPEYHRHVAAAREQLDAGAFAAAWEEGRAMTAEQAVAFALEDALV